MSTQQRYLSYILPLFLICVLAGCFGTGGAVEQGAGPEETTALISRVSDGDTVVVYGERVKLVFDQGKTDRYDRLLAYVYVDDLFVNAEIVRRGYARASEVEPNTRYADLFEKLEAEARELKVGMWILPEPEPTEEAPGEVQRPTEGEYKFVASKSSEVFHIPSCRWGKRIAEGNRVYFQTYKEAVESDRRPCKVCRPHE